MPKDIPCPNPGCAHVFPAGAIVGVAALVCPKCGGVFQVKPKKPDPPPAVVSPPTTARGKAARYALLVWLLAGLIVFLSLGLITAAFYRQPARPPAGPEPFRSAEHNYSLRLPGPPWKQDTDLAKRLSGVLAFRREAPDAQVALAVRQYANHVPTAEELRDDAVARLRKFPIENLQFEDKSDGATFAGRPVGRIVFQGAVDGMIVSGDVHFLAHQGAAYWLYRWCPTAVVEQTAADLADLADRFALLDQRPDWQPPRRTFTGTKVGYKLTAEGDRWDKAAYPPENYDPVADLALIGKLPDGAVDPTRQAQLLVLLLPGGDGDPAGRAKAHLLARQKEVYPETTVADLPPADDKARADKVGNVPGRVLTLRLTNTKERERFVVLGVVPRPEGPIVIWAECDFVRRSAWEADFRKLLASYTQRK